MSSMPYSDINFDQHELQVVQSPEATIYRFYKPDTRLFGLSVIVSEGITAVTGDWGNWIFSREFTPGKGCHYSEDYWNEKASIASRQRPKEWSDEATRNRIREMQREHEGELSQEEVEFLDGLLIETYNTEHEYISYANEHRVGIFEDWEYIPFVQSTDVWLKVVYDAFTEICNRLKGNESEKQ